MTSTSMADKSTLSEGERLMSSPLLQSWGFASASLLGVGNLVLIAYVVLSHWRMLDELTISTLLLPLCIVIYGQWARVRKCILKIRGQESAMPSDFSSKAEEPTRNGLRLAVAALSDSLFWAYLSDAYLLIYIVVLLGKLHK
jgi:hypothetical protein